MKSLTFLLLDVSHWVVPQKNIVTQKKDATVPQCPFLWNCISRSFAKRNEHSFLITIHIGRGGHTIGWGGATQRYIHITYALTSFEFYWHLTFVSQVVHLICLSHVVSGYVSQNVRPLTQRPPRTIFFGSCQNPVRVGTKNKHIAIGKIRTSFRRNGFAWSLVNGFSRLDSWWSWGSDEGIRLQTPPTSPTSHSVVSRCFKG